MTRNVGGADKKARLVIGVAAAAVALLVNVGTTIQLVLFVVAAIALVTALVGFCPLNRILGINTCKVDGA